MNLQHDEGTTMDPGLLILHLDGELDAAQDAAVTAHLQACTECRMLATSLTSRIRRVSHALADADFRTPPVEAWQDVRDALRHTAPRRARWPVAAGLLLAVGATALVAAPPLREWIADRVDAFTARGASEAAPVVDDGSASVGFAATGPVLDVVIDSVQRSGTLAIEFTAADAARIAVTAGGSEQLAVHAAGARITNRSTSSASYTLTVSSPVERVRVRVGTHAPLLLHRGDASGTVHIDLVSGRVRNTRADDDP